MTSQAVSETDTDVLVREFQNLVKAEATIVDERNLALTKIKPAIEEAALRILCTVNRLVLPENIGGTSSISSEEETVHVILQSNNANQGHYSVRIPLSSIVIETTSEHTVSSQFRISGLVTDLLKLSEAIASELKSQK